MMINHNILVSVCVIWDRKNQDLGVTLERLSNSLSLKYEYFEIIVVMTGTDLHSVTASDISAKNVRIMTQNDQSGHYRMRSIAASEAIGDLVVVTSVEEIKCFNIIEMLALAEKNNLVVAGRHKKVDFLTKSLSLPMIYLGRMAGFTSSINDARTIIYPRTSLNKILALTDIDLALRFLPLNLGVRTIYYSASNKVPRGYQDLSERLRILYALVINLAPLSLRILSIVSGAIMPIAVSFIGYVFFVWMTYEKVQEGWVTLSLLGGSGLLFAALSVFGVSIGLQRILRELIKQPLDDVIYDVEALNIFKDTQKKLNVESEISERADE